MPGTWYFGKRLLIILSIATMLSVFWFTYSHQQEIFPPQSKFQHRNYPFMAFLTLQYENGSRNCGGTLVGKNYILTAAHCVESALSASIMLGTDNILEESKSTLYFESETFIVHEKFNSSTYDNDIALIYLDLDVPIDEDIREVSFFLPNNVVADNESSFVVLGWGVNNMELNDRLLEKPVTIVDDIFCFLLQVRDLEEEIIDDSKICGLGESGPCHGDSGGPLLFENIQIGIVSLGDNNCRDSVPTVYTDISYYKDWINDEMKNVIEIR